MIKNIPINHEWILAHIPHQGTMCLLDEVIEWTEDDITCISTNHINFDNPLRLNGQLDTVIGIEYAAQAMAIHGALLNPVSKLDKDAEHGYLTSVRAVNIHEPRLDVFTGALVVKALRQSGNENNVLYQFTIHHEQQLLIEGRVSVMIKPA